MRDDAYLCYKTIMSLDDTSLDEIKNTRKKPWFVYILCCADNTLYCGISVNIEQRLEMHNGIRKAGAKYTKGRRPVTLVACREVATQSQALQLEILVKKQPKKHKISFLQNYQAPQENKDE